MTDPIATLKILAVFQGSKEVQITASIGRAAADAQGDGWVCPVQLTPVYAEAMNVKGVDSFHATWLACSLVLKLLGHLKSEAVSLRAEDGSEFPLEAYLAGLGDAAGR